MRKKILFLDHTPFVGGAQLSLIHHLEKVDREKFDIIICCSGSAEKIGLLDKYRKMGIKFYIISFGKLKTFNPISVIRFIISIFSTFKIIRKEKINLVISNTVRAALVSSLAARISNIKSIWFIRDFTFPQVFFRLFSRYPEKIIFNAQAVFSYYKKSLYNQDKSVVIYVGRNFYENVDKFNKDDIKKQRQLWGADENTFIIGYIGRLVDWKGPQVLTRAVDLLVKRGITNIKCIIVGTGKDQEGENEGELRKITKDNNLDRYINFTGQVENISKILLSLNVLCLTSIKAEPFSSTVIDAMMARVPVIGTDIGGTPEIIFNKETGLLIKPDNAEYLSGAIERLIKDSGSRNKIIDNAYKRVMKHHKAKLTTNQLERIYLSLF